MDSIFVISYVIFLIVIININEKCDYYENKKNNDVKILYLILSQIWWVHDNEAFLKAQFTQNEKVTCYEESLVKEMGKTEHRNTEINNSRAFMASNAPRCIVRDTCDTRGYFSELQPDATCVRSPCAVECVPHRSLRKRLITPGIFHTPPRAIFAPHTVSGWRGSAFSWWNDPEWSTSLVKPYQVIQCRHKEMLMVVADLFVGWLSFQDAFPPPHGCLPEITQITRTCSARIKKTTTLSWNPHPPGHPPNVFSGHKYWPHDFFRRCLFVSAALPRRASLTSI